MARRDVDLVIRAKDESTKAIEAVNAALEAFVGSQKKATDSAKDSSSVLGRLQTAFAELDKSLAGATASQKLAKDLNDAVAAMNRVEKATSEAAADALEYGVKSAQAAAQVKKLRDEVDKSAESMRKQKDLISQAAGVQTKLNDAVRKATADRNKLLNADERMVGQIERQQTAVDKARTSYEKLAEKIRATEQPSRTLQERFEKAGTALRNQESKLAALGNAYIKNRADSEKATSALEGLNQKFAQNGTAIERMKAGLESTQAAYAGLKSSVRDAAKYQTDLSTSAAKAAEALNRQQKELLDSKAAIAAMGAQSAASQQQIGALAQKGVMDLRWAFHSARTETDAAKQAMIDAQATAQRLGKEFSSTAAPTQQLADAFNRAREAARLAKQEYQAQLQALQQLRTLPSFQMGPRQDPLGSLSDSRQAYAATQAALQQQLQTLRAASAENARLGQSSTQAAAGMQRMQTQARATGGAMRQASTETAGFAGALRSLYGESRQAMSWTQRLRGQVLSMIAAYAGLYTVVQQIRNVVDAYRTLEAVQSRLNVVFDGDAARGAQEIEFLRRNADRLGISLRELGDEYSKFAVATKGTNLEGEQTRKIFLAVAEAGRVNKLSIDQIRGTYLALTQMVSKGKIQAEELRRQLGDRLPGAFQIMADAVGVTTQELDKMLEQGQLFSETALPLFAEEMTKRFGDQLPAALRTTTTELGKLENNLFQSALQVGNAGFIDSFTEALRALNEALTSTEGVAFLEKLGRGLANVTDVVTALIKNFDLLIIATSTFVGIKLVPFVLASVAAFNRLRYGSFDTHVALYRSAAAANANTVALTGMAGAAARARGAIAALTSSTGVGLLITGVAAAIGVWATSADDATEAMVTHRKIVDDVANAYQEAGGKAEDWASKIKNTTLAQARRNLEVLQEQQALARRNLASLFVNDSFSPFPDFGLIAGKGSSQKNELADLTRAFRDGTKTIEEFRDAVSSISEDAANDSIKGLALELLDATDEAAAMAKRVEEAAIAVKVLEKNGEEADAALLGLTDSTDKTKLAMEKAAKEAEIFNGALDEMRGMIPELADEMKRLKDMGKLDEIFGTAGVPKTVEEMLEAIKLLGDARAAINLDSMGAATGSVGKSVALLKQFEGFRSEPYYDVNAFRAGYGSDTVTLADGSIQKITEGMRVSQEDALRDLVRRTKEFQDVIKGQIGGRFNSFSDEQQAALTSIAYNYGRLPERIIDAVKTGSAEEIAAAVRKLAGDNGGINNDRRNAEAAILETGSPGLTQDLVELEAKRNEQIAEFNESQARTIENNEFQLQQEILKQQGLERQAAINEAIRKAEQDALQAGTTLSAQQRAEIERTTAALYDQQNIRAEAEAAEQRVNDLMAIRTQLQEQMQLASELGDNEALLRAETGLIEVNAQLEEAIAKSIALWQNLGGPGADQAIAKLQTMKLTLQTGAQQAFLDWQKVGNLFASGLTNAFDKFAQAVAEGKDIGEAAREAFLQFAADFLREIARMIIQQAILNALKAFFPGFGVGVGHGGGVIGQLGRTRNVSPALFANAVRYHSGGIAGLGPNEVPAILERNEEILTRDDPRHRYNGGLNPDSGGAPATNVKIVNAFDAAAVLEEALNTRVGEKAILNQVQSNQGAWKNALGITQ